MINATVDVLDAHQGVELQVDDARAKAAAFFNSKKMQGAMVKSDLVELTDILPEPVCCYWELGNMHVSCEASSPSSGPVAS